MAAISIDLRRCVDDGRGVVQVEMDVLEMDVDRWLRERRGSWAELRRDEGMSSRLGGRSGRSAKQCDRGANARA